MGIEVPAPVINAESARLNFTNEGGIEGTTRFLKNITGMWLLEMLRGFAPFPIEKLHIIGGGSANALLNQWTADAQMKEMTAAFGLPK